MDYQQIIRTIIDPIVEHKEAILLREMDEESGKASTIIICAEPDDTARLIGRKGMIADSLREVISIAGKTDGKRIFLKFESFEKKADDEE